MRQYLMKPAAGPIDQEARYRRFEGRMTAMQNAIEKLEARIAELEAARQTGTVKITGKKAVAA